MIIYGEGKKIISSFELAAEYHINLQNNIEYFGDVDSEGFLIYKLFKDKFSDYMIKICNPLYLMLLDDFDIEVLPTLRNFLVDDDLKNHFIESVDMLDIEESNLGKYHLLEPKVLACAIEVVNSEFEEYYSNKIIDILTSKKYIPQEAIALSR